MYLRYQLFDDQRDVMILLARIMILILYGYFGFTYVTDHGSFVTYLKSVDAPIPEFTAIVATLVEFFGGLALLFGFWTRPIAAIFVVYTIGTGIIGHAFWNASNPADHHTLFVHFFKNVSIAGGFLFLCLLGPGKYSFDKR
ncbi:DoxX family protein [Pseudomonas sp. PB106]|uniref:DoxX family protein n=1 Tax=Pseudomonas sp. PB106 TaxID=2494699 RepID=UPI00131B1161|nr:DoxX family protein [Pseudomonas sp. PB106]KAE9644703.1 DoxX family protein [Pseudomonas sp. PB106]